MDASVSSSLFMGTPLMSLSFLIRSIGPVPAVMLACTVPLRISLMSVMMNLKFYRESQAQTLIYEIIMHLDDGMANCSPPEVLNNLLPGCAKVGP